MMNMRTAAALILSGALMLSFSACSKEMVPSASDSSTASSVVETTSSTTAASETSVSQIEVKPVSSEKLAEIAAVDYADYALSEDDDLKTMEKKIETKYGIDIIYGEDIRTEFGDETEQLSVAKFTDEELIRKAMKSIDEVISIYPKTFLCQLALSEDSPLKIYMTGHIKSITYPDASINAFTSDTDSEGEVYLVIDVAGAEGVFNPVDVMHEIVHLTDFKLKKEGLLKTEDWAKLNPDGFTYLEKIDERSEDKYNFGQAEYCPLKKGTSPSDVYFIAPYSQTNEYEDRATLLTDALVFALYGYEVEPDVYKCPNLQVKMEYWMGQVREGFDTSYWEKIPWEDSYSKLK